MARTQVAERLHRDRDRRYDTKYDEDKVLGWLRQGLGPSAVVRRLREEDGIEITPAAISQLRKRHGLQPMRAYRMGLIPWTLAPQYRDSYPAKMLRREQRRRSGLDVSEAHIAELDRWIDRLREEQAVVAYSEATGFVYVPARPGIDTDLIRVPDEDQ